MYKLFPKLLLKKKLNWFCRNTVIIFFLFHLFFPGSLGASQVTLTWDASNSSHVKGYKIHYGQNSSSKSYNHTVIVGNHTNYTLTGLDTNSMYFFATTAYGKWGRESPYSNQVSHTVTKNSTSSSGGGGCKFASNSGLGLLESLLFFLPLVVAARRTMEKLRCKMVK